VERELVLAALRRAGFVQKDAAALLGVSRRKLNYMVQRMGITHPSWRRNRAEPGARPAAEPFDELAAEAIDDLESPDGDGLGSAGADVEEDPGVG
jgi:hypothetical protein